MQEQTGPQVEDGYTRLANELLDALISARLTSRQWAVVMAIVRKTYGFNKKHDDLGLGQLSEMTGIAKPHVSVAVRELESQKIITRKAGKFAHTLGINKHHKSWLGVTESVTVTETVTGYQIGIKRVTESVTPPVTESVTTKDNPSKDNQKTLALFEQFYATYPKKRSRDDALKAWLKLNPNEHLVDEILQAVQRAKTSVEWLESGGKYVPYPATWLRAAGWLDVMTPSVSKASDNRFKGAK